MRTFSGDACKIFFKLRVSDPAPAHIHPHPGRYCRLEAEPCEGRPIVSNQIPIPIRTSLSPPDFQRTRVIYVGHLGGSTRGKARSRRTFFKVGECDENSLMMMLPSHLRFTTTPETQENKTISYLSFSLSSFLSLVCNFKLHFPILPLPSPMLLFSTLLLLLLLSSPIF